MTDPAAVAADVPPTDMEYAGDTVEETAADDGRFQVRLANFTGPFDLLLNLISQRRMDVTEVALHVVTDDFIAYTKNLGPDADLEQTTEFLVIAATLLDLKAARLLPSGEVEDPEDLALLEARDLLFARLLQYRAYKQVAILFSELESAALQRYPRAVSLDARYADLLPEVQIGVDAKRFAEIAAAAIAPKPVPTVGLDHLHGSSVSVPDQAHRLSELLLAASGEMLTFSELVAECANGLEVVARFLGLLELYRERAVVFDQPEALGELKVGWTGDRDTYDIDIDATEDYG